MADNPSKTYGLLGTLGAEPPRNGLLDYIGAPTGLATDLFIDNLTPLSPTNTLFGLGSALSVPMFGQDKSLAGILASAPPPPAFGSLADIIAPPKPPPARYVPPPKPRPVEPEIKRRAFFSFHFDDIMRVNNVRNTWKITHADSSSNRSFYDSSLWETRKVTKPEVIKQLIRTGVLYTSAVCVLVGSNTWSRRWVRYEIARAIVDRRGLLAVHINNIHHHQTRTPHARGRNPLSHMGIAKLQSDKWLDPEYYLYEMSLVSDGYGRTIEHWTRYGDYVTAVQKPDWLTDPPLNHVMPFSANTSEYDYVSDRGHRNIGSWIDKAAKQTGR
jgi:hypothetical protein